MKTKSKPSAFELATFFQSNAPLPPGLINAGCGLFRKAGKVQPVHKHPGMFELTCIFRGREQIMLADRTVLASRGMIVVVRPGEEHGGVREMLHPGEFAWLIIDMARLRRVYGKAFAAVAETLTGVERPAFGASTQAAELFRAIIGECRARESFSETIIAAHLHTLLSLVARDYMSHMARRESRHAVGERQIRTARAWIDRHPEENTTVAEMAAKVCLKPSRLHELFVRHTGFTPIEYRNRQRIEAAKCLLNETNRSITDIAFELGFCASQYFATVFKQYEGIPSYISGRPR
jgi:AraC-like DNA-binding protein